MVDFLYTFLHSQSGLSPFIHLLRLYSAFAGHDNFNPAFLFFLLISFLKKALPKTRLSSGASISHLFPLDALWWALYSILWGHSLVWLEQGLRSPCACTDGLGALGDHQWSLVLNLHLSTPGNVPSTHRHFPLENVGKMAGNKVCGGSPSFPQIIRQTDTVFWPSPVFLQGSVFI